MSPVGWDDKDWLEVILKNYEEDNRLKKIISVKSSAATKAGDNYTSLMLRSTIVGYLGSGTEISKNFIVKKKLPSNTAESLISRVFCRETKVYKKILDAYSELVRGTPFANEEMWAKCYYGSYDSVVMDDLKIGGYILADRKAGLDLSHSLLVMTSLGRLHGYSVVALKRGLVDPLVVGTFGFLEESCQSFYDSGFTGLSNAIRNSWGPEWSEAADRVKEFAKTARMRLLEKANEEPPLKVICHGDCWVNNQMYRYDHQGNPVHLKFVDFQISHHASFAWDINYFLHSSVRPHIRGPNYTALLTRYRDSLEETLKILGYDGEAPSTEQVAKECDRLTTFAFITDAIITPVIICNQEDVVELDDLMANPENSEKIYASQNYQEYMKPALTEYMKNGIV